MSGRLRVLHVITRLITGGADENTVYTVEGLDPERYQVSLAAGVPSESEMIARLERTRFLSVPHLQRELRPVKDILALWELVRILKDGRYHLVHTHEAKGGVLGRFAARIAGVPVVVHTLHGITFHRHLPAALRWTYLFLERLAEKCTDLFICVGEDLRRTYLKHRIGRSEKYVVIRSGFDVPKFYQAGEEREIHRRALRRGLGLPDDVVVVGTVARLEQRKGVQFFIEAARRLCPKWPNLHFTVAGQGHYRPQLEQQVDHLSLHDRFHFLGFVPKVEEYLAGLDVFVLSSLWEGLPRALVQAGAVGLPIITFEVEGAWEVVREGENGFIIPSRDVDGLVEKVELLLRDPGRAAKMGQQGRNHLLRDWDYQVMVNRIESVYRELAGNGETGRGLTAWAEKVQEERTC